MSGPPLDVKPPPDMAPGPALIGAVSSAPNASIIQGEAIYVVGIATGDIYLEDGVKMIQVQIQAHWGGWRRLCVPLASVGKAA